MLFVTSLYKNLTLVCTVPGTDGDITIENGISHKVECQGGLSTAYNNVQCQNGKFVDDGGNQITTRLCGNGELNEIWWKWK